jgi:hypothetical protein
MDTYKVGDTVKVVNTGSCFPDYESWARKVGLRSWVRGASCKFGAEGEVVALAPHGGGEDWLLAAVNILGQDYIMCVTGLKVLKESNWHKHHNCIVAWAKGEEIQYKTTLSNTWKDYTGVTGPCWDRHWEYRIKPANPNADKIAELELQIQKLAGELKALRDENCS